MLVNQSLSMKVKQSLVNFLERSHICKRYVETEFCARRNDVVYINKWSPQRGGVPVGRDSTLQTKFGNQ